MSDFRICAVLTEVRFYVNAEENPDPLPEKLKALLPMFQKYAPYWDGVPLSPMQSVEMMMDVIRKLGPEDSGAFLSHRGNQQWF